MKAKWKLNEALCAALMSHSTVCMCELGVKLLHFTRRKLLQLKHSAKYNSIHKVIHSFEDSGPDRTMIGP